MQRPDLVETVGLDFFLARKVAAVIVAVSRWPLGLGGRLAVRSDLVAAVDEYASRMFEELDYRREVRTIASKVLLVFEGEWRMQTWLLIVLEGLGRLACRVESLAGVCG